MDRKLLFMYFIIFNMLFSTMAFAYSPTTVDSSVACRNEKLSPEEINILWDNYLRTGFTPTNIYSGTPEELKAEEKTKIKEEPKAGEEGLIPSIMNMAGDKAIATVDIDTGKKVSEDALCFTKVISGDYAYGGILSDSLRVGRCTEDTPGCSVSGEGLQFKNTEGALKIYWEGVKAIIGLGEEKTQPGSYLAGPVNTEQLKEQEEVVSAFGTSEAVESADGTAAESDLASTGAASNELELMKVNHEAQPNAMSSLWVDDMSAEFLMLCNNQDSGNRCRVLLYSFFDKYYNSYYSGGLVVVAGGPVAWGATKKLFGGISAFKYGGKITTGIKKVTDPVKEFMTNTWYKLTEKDFKYFSSNVLGKTQAALKHGGIGDGLKVLGDNVYEANTSKAIAAAQKELVPKLTTTESKEAIGAVLEARASAAEYGKGYLNSLKNAAPEYKLKAAMQAGENAPALLGAEMNKAFLEKNYAGWMYDSAGAKAISSVPITDKVAAEGFLKGNLDPAKIYKMVPGQSQGNHVIGNLKNFMQNHAGSDFIVDIGGNPVILNAGTVDGIVAQAGKEGITELEIKAGSRLNIDFAEFGGYDGFSKKFAKDYFDDVSKKYSVAATNYQAVTEALQSAKKIPTRSPNAMKFMMNVMNGKGGAAGSFILKYETIPALYWLAKTSDSSPIKAYMIKDQDITNVKAYTGPDAIYAGAYIDVFAKEGSDNGDLFNKALKYTLFPLDLFSKVAPTATGYLKSFFGHQFRDTPGGVIIYNEALKCTTASCFISLTGSKKIVNAGEVNLRTDSLLMSGKSLQGTKNYFVEFPDSDVYKKTGLTLGAFVHGMNVVGKQGEINLASAAAKKEDCLTKSKELTIAGVPVGSIMASDADPAKLAMPIGIFENTIGFVLPGLPGLGVGIAVSLLIQDDIQEQIGECVDTIDGYYVTYSLIPYKPEEDNGIMSKIKETVSEGKEQKPSMLTDTAIGKVADKIKDQFSSIIQDKTHEGIQINLDTKGKTSQSVSLEDVFLIWEGPNASQTNLKYKDTGKLALVDKDGNAAIMDFDKGTFTINGETISNPDIVRLMEKDNLGPFIAMPVVVTVIPAISSGDMFEAKTNGDFVVKDPGMLDCIRQGVFEQTGQEMTGSSLFEHMGPVTQMLLENGQTVAPTLIGSSSYFEILGGSTGRVTLYNSTLTVTKDRSIIVRNAKETNQYDKVVGIAFEKGSILYKPETNEFIMWIKIMAEMDGKFVSSMTPTHTTQINEETGCEEDAFDLKLAPLQGDVTAAEDVDKMNTALEKAGPFQYFKTPEYTIMFYAQMVDGVCKRFMKVMDKDGNVISDSEITSITATPDGYEITTADGKTHDIGFSAENGQPMLTFDGQKSPLTIAQGKDGAFFYDPSTGKWYVDNAQLLPIDDDFKRLGSNTVGNSNTPGGNPIEGGLNPSSGSGSSWDIPLTDDWLLYGLVMLFSGMFVYLISRKDE